MPAPAVLTPSFAGDLERLLLLRESMLARDVDMDHLVVADTEDLDVLRRALPSERLHLMTTREVLRPAVERARRLGGVRALRVAARALGQPQQALSGWWAQQLVKLQVGETTGRPWVLCVDSDTVFLRPTAAHEWLTDDGRPILLEHENFPSGPAIRRYDADSRRLLGLPGVARVRHTYVGNGVPIVTSVAQEMLTHLAELTGQTWERAMLAARATEYTTYGLFARHVHGLRDVVPRDLRRYWLLQDPNDEAALESELTRCVRERPEVCLATVHSSHGVPASAYRGMFERLWN